MIRHSEVADFRQCPMKWWLKWVNRWQSGDSVASSLGTAWHTVMATHYGIIQRWQESGHSPGLIVVGKEVEPAIEYFHGTDHYDKLIWMYDGYLDHWGVDPDWEIVEYESTQQVEISPGLWYEWTTDVLVRDHTLNKLRVVDHKSTSSQLRKGEVDLSDQLGLYIRAQNMRGVRVADGVISQARTEKLKRPMTLEERYQRMPSYRSPVELENIWDDMLEVVRVMLEYRRTPEVPPYSSPDPRVCSWKCDFLEAHLILRKMPKAKWGQRLIPLLQNHGFRQGDVPRGSDRLIT